MKEILITSSVLIVALLVLRLVFAKKVRRTLIYAAWALVALRLLVPVQIGQLDFSVLTAAQPLMETVTEFSGLRVIGQNEREAETQVILDYIERDQTVFTPETQEYIQDCLERNESKEHIATAISKTQSPENTFVPEAQQQVTQQVAEQTNFVSIGQLATIVWLAGVAVMAVWFAAVNLRHSLSLRKYREKLKCDSPIAVYVSEKVGSPCLVGLLRPVIYLTPESAADEATRRHVLTHELTHYAHRDHIWSLVRCVCLCVYWFDPLVWAAAWFSRRDCELACDEGALKRLGEGERIAYGKSLLDVVSHASAPAHLIRTATAMNETKSQLRERVNFIVKRPKWSIIAAICMVLVCAIVAGCAAAGPTVGQSGGESHGGENGTTAPGELGTLSGSCISLHSVDGKLAILCNDNLILTEYSHYNTIPLSLSLDGKSAVCQPGPLLYIHDGMVEKIADQAVSYSLSVSGNAVAFQTEQGGGLFLYHRETGEIQQVVTTAEGSVWDYAISPDGQTLAYILQQGGLMLYQNGAAESIIPLSQPRDYRLISIDNNADYIYMRRSSGSVSCVNRNGERTSVARISNIYWELGQLDGIFYCNADHTQLLINGNSGSELSVQGQPGVQLFSGYSGRPLQPSMAPFHQDPRATTCPFDDLSKQVWQSLSYVSTSPKSYAFWYPNENGEYVQSSAYQAYNTDCWMDPMGRYVFYTDTNRYLYVLDTQNGGKVTLLGTEVDCYAVKNDGSALCYGDRYLYEYKDYHKYGGNLYTLDPQDGTKLGRLQTDVLEAMFFSQNNQLFFLTSDNGQKRLYTLDDKGKARLVLEDVEQLSRGECGILFVEAEDHFYIIQDDRLIPLQVKNLA